MNRLFNAIFIEADWNLIWDKVGTVLVDRRFWPSVLTMILLVFGSPEALDQVDGLSEQAQAYTQIVLQFLGLVIPYLKLTDAWTQRPPSGLRFKEDNSEMDRFVETLKKELNA